MYAIIKTGGKQYRVALNDIIDVELLEGEQGAAIEFADILLVSDGDSTVIGEPAVSGYFVKGELIGQAAGPKITSVKYIPGNHTKKFGHRQKYSRVKITEIGQKRHKEAKHGT